MQQAGVLCSDLRCHRADTVQKYLALDTEGIILPAPDTQRIRCCLPCCQHHQLFALRVDAQRHERRISHGLQRCAVDVDAVILGTDAQAQQRCIPDVSFELIPIRNLVSNQEYQRPLSENHIRKALEEFDVYQINPVKVSRRDGINYVFDGQHTIEIIASESGSRDTPVWCMIYDDLKYKEEAHIFADQQKHVKALSSFETFKAHIEADDPKQKMIEAIVQSYGLAITSTKAKNGISAVSTLERIYDKYGQAVLDRTLRLAAATWEGENNSFSGNILMGIARIVVAYGDTVRDDVFKDHVGRVSVKAIIRAAKERRPGALGYSEAMIIEYNKKSKFRLSLKTLYGGKAMSGEDDFGEE